MPTRVPNTQTGSLTDHQHGTDDTFVGFTYLHGDAFSMVDASRGGDDTLTGGAGPGFTFGPFGGVTNNLYGDADSLHDSARGGDDRLTGGDGSTNNLFGDA